MRHYTAVILILVYSIISWNKNYGNFLRKTTYMHETEQSHCLYGAVYIGHDLYPTILLHLNSFLTKIMVTFY